MHSGTWLNSDMKFGSRRSHTERLLYMFVDIMLDNKAMKEIGIPKSHPMESSGLNLPV